jgi:signal transduction histidine kinase
LGQRLSSIRLSTQILKDGIPKKFNKILSNIKKIEKDIDLSITEIRKLSAKLYPSELELFGLAPALTSLCKKYGKEMNIPVKYNFHDVQSVDKNISTVLYRVVQEALANINEHACASSVDIDLKIEKITINLSIIDNGKGFDPEKVSLNIVTGHGLGIISMRERVESVGGLFRVNSKVGQGTNIDVIIPITNYESKQEN